MNNEPVAWMETYKGEPNNLDWDKSNLNYGSEFHDVVPLYTHPVKEPTDLELLKMIGEKFTRFGFEGDYVVEDSELVEFARAIMKRCGIISGTDK